MPLYDTPVILESILETMADAVIVVDLLGRIRLFNLASETMFGYSEPEMIGKEVTPLIALPFYQPDRCLGEINQDPDGHVILTNHETQAHRKGGECFPISISVGENRFPDAPGYVAIIRDLTQTKAERDHLTDLESRHAHLSRVMAASQLGTAIAHELNQPLSALVNYMDAGLAYAERTHGEAEDPTVSIMEKAAAEARKASRILTRLREFVERGHAEQTHVDLERACDNALSLVLPSFRHHPIKLSRHCPPDLPKVRASQVQVEQVLVNLFRNACEAMTGPSMDEGPARLLLDAQSDDQMVRFSVSDTGPGMTEAALTHLFEPLYTTKSDGLGVGLSLCRDLVRSHGGQMHGHVNAQGGMTFSFTLPKAGLSDD